MRPYVPLKRKVVPTITEDVIEFESPMKGSVHFAKQRVERGAAGGLRWEWSVIPDFSFTSGKLEKMLFLKYKFDWDELKAQGVDGFVGAITLTYQNSEDVLVPVRFSDELKFSGQWRWKKIGSFEETKERYTDGHSSTFKFSLTKVLKFFDDSDGVLKQKKVQISPMTRIDRADELIEYDSCQMSIKLVSEAKIKECWSSGLKWECHVVTGDHLSPTGIPEQMTFLKWKFDWDELKALGVEELVGEITVSHKNQLGAPVAIRFAVKLVQSGQCIWKRIDKVALTFRTQQRIFVFDFKFSLKKIFKKPEVLLHTDAVLVLEEKKVAVNKAYLSTISQFFKTLFNSDFEEKSMDEIPIGDVPYDDFNQLMDVIHPTNPSQVTVAAAEILLDLADRFMIPAVTAQVEHHLRYNPDVPFFVLLELADRYKLADTLERCVAQFATVDDIGLLNDYSATFKPSDELSLKLFHRTLNVMKE